MRIPYKTVKITNSLNPDDAGKYYARVKSRGKIDVRNLAQRIASGSTISSPDTFAMLEALFMIIPDYLLDGYIVDLGALGTFVPSVKSEGTRDKKDFTASKIKKASIIFKPGKHVKMQLADAKYEKI